MDREFDKDQAALLFDRLGVTVTGVRVVLSLTKGEKICGGNGSNPAL